MGRQETPRASSKPHHLPEDVELQDVNAIHFNRIHVLDIPVLAVGSRGKFAVFDAKPLGDYIGSLSLQLFYV
jgi:hypothetical protein